MNAEALRITLQSPPALFVVMLLASLSNGMKQMRGAAHAGTPVTLLEYLQHWPETGAMLIGNMIAFVGLIIYDQLNFASALGIGYGVNSMVDLVRPAGRSQSLRGPMTVTIVDPSRSPPTVSSPPTVPLRP